MTTISVPATNIRFARKSLNNFLQHQSSTIFYCWAWLQQEAGQAVL